MGVIVTATKSAPRMPEITKVDCPKLFMDASAFNVISTAARVSSVPIVQPRAISTQPVTAPPTLDAMAKVP